MEQVRQSGIEIDSGGEAPVQHFFQKAGYKHYEINEVYNYLEFHVIQNKSLKKFDIEIGLSSNVFKTRDGERYIRELKVDGTTPPNVQTICRCIRRKPCFTLEPQN